MADTLPTIIEEIVDQVLEITPPGFKLLKTPFAVFMRGREDAARDILLKRIAEAEVEELQAHVVYRCPRSPRTIDQQLYKGELLHLLHFRALRRV